MQGDESGFPIVSSFSSFDIDTDARTFCAIQEPDGTLLFGGNTLISFDGERWNHSVIPNSYALRSLDLGKDGRLWVAAFGEIGWFERTSDRKWNYHSLLKFLPADEVAVGEVWR